GELARTRVARRHPQPRELCERGAATAVVGRLEAALEVGLRRREVALAERRVACGEVRLRENRRVDADAARERGPDVVGGLVEALEPDGLVRARQLRLGRLDEREEALRVAPPPLL